MLTLQHCDEKEVAGRSVKRALQEHSPATSASSSLTSSWQRGLRIVLPDSPTSQSAMQHNHIDTVAVLLHVNHYFRAHVTIMSNCIMLFCQ